MTTISCGGNAEKVGETTAAVVERLNLRMSFIEDGGRADYSSYGNSPRASVNAAAHSLNM